jgi:hypothetical protein
MYIGLCAQYPLFLSDLNEICTLLTDFRKILKYKISWKSIPLELTWTMWADSWTDMMKLTVAFRNFANASEH